MDLELKDDVKLVCSRPYPVPRLHESMFRKEVNRLVLLGVLEEANDLEWGVPFFAQTKPKTNCIRLLSEFLKLNRQLKLIPFSMPKKIEIIINLEGF